MIVVDKIGAANKCITQDFVQVARNTKKSTLLEMVGVDIKKYEQNKDRKLNFFNALSCFSFQWKSSS